MTVVCTRIRGENLAPEDGSTCDPYLNITIHHLSGTQKLRTETVKENNQSPEWREIKDFQFAWDGQSQLPIVEFVVMDHDSLSP